jgi:hypothetical protein
MITVPVGSVPEGARVKVVAAVPVLMPVIVLDGLVNVELEMRIHVLIR